MVTARTVRGDHMTSRYETRRSARRTSMRTLALLMALGLAAAACGSGHKASSASTAATTTPNPTATTATTNTGSSTTSSSAATTAPTAAVTTPTTAAATMTTAPAGKKFGTLASPCGAGAATGATDKGVTDTNLTIGYGDDEGYAAAPGLDKEMSDAMKAMIDWCNQQGGINGRQVVGNFYDGKVTEVDKAMTQACTDKVFMMVGEGYVFDSGQEQIRIGCQLPAIPGFAVSGAFNQGPGVRNPVPAPGD